MSVEYEIDPSEFMVLVADKASQFVYVNETYLQVSGYCWSELAGSHIATMLHKDTPPQVNQAMHRTLQQMQSWTGIIKNQRKNGDYYWVRLNMSPLHVRGAYAGALLVHSHATREEIARFEPLYQRLCADKTLRMSHGRAIRDTFINRALDKIRHRGLASRIWGVIITLDLVTMLSLLTVAGPSMRTWIAVAVLLTLSLLFGAHLFRTIVTPLREAVRLSSRIAAGNLTALPHTERSDEIGALNRATTQMSVNMHATVLDIRSGVRRLSEATAEIANGTQELSGRTEQQAGHIEQNASAIEVISETVKQTANAARQASQFSQAACVAADSGGEVVGEVIATMQGIMQSSKKISEIIGLIDSIAFQTNILALNAAVEAARAGENGRGFAVVAGEVRNLAQRSAKSAREIKTLISTSSEQVDRGSALVNVAGKTIGDVVAQVRRVAELVGSIADASVAQATGVGEIGDSVDQLDVMTQQNATLVQKNTLFAASLRTESACLSHAVSVFKLSESESLELFSATQNTAEQGAARSLHTRAA